MPNPQYAARIPEPLLSRVEAWQEATDTPKDSDAVRELMGLGVEVWEAEESEVVQGRTD